jgi:hypothetical protein
MLVQSGPGKVKCRANLKYVKKIARFEELDAKRERATLRLETASLFQWDYFLRDNAALNLGKFKLNSYIVFFLKVVTL